MAKSQFYIKLSSKPGFLTPEARLPFIKLRKAFIKALIFHHFTLQYHIKVKTNPLVYAIDKVLSQLT